MTARFHSPFYVTDFFVTMTFVEVLNAMVCAADPAQLHRLLLGLCARQGHRSPDNYFRWGFEGYRFWIQQRMAYRSEVFFPERLLTLDRYSAKSGMSEEC